MNKFHLQKNVLYLSQLLPKFPWCSGQMCFIDKSLQILLSTGWVPGPSVSTILFCYRLLHLRRVRQQPKTSHETPVNHPWITREPPLIHPWTIRETSVLETQKTWKNWVRDLKNWFCTMSDPWNTRETPVKQPWSIREAPVKHPWMIRGRSVNMH